MLSNKCPGNAFLADLRNRARRKSYHDSYGTGDSQTRVMHALFCSLAAAAWCVAIVTSRSALDSAPTGYTGMAAPSTDAANRAMYTQKYEQPSMPMPKQSMPPRTGPLDIFMVAHTHDDCGWLKTVFGYYNASVNFILTSVTEALAAHPDRRFIWSEVKWFEMWWPQQTAATQELFKRLVATGQLEFVGAGWSQSDVSRLVEARLGYLNRPLPVCFSTFCCCPFVTLSFFFH